MVDSGCPYFWAFDKSTFGRGYDQASSKSANLQTGFSFSTSYAGKATSGSIVNDTIQIGNMIFDNQAFGVVDVCGIADAIPTVSGILGLSLYSTFNWFVGSSSGAASPHASFWYQHEGSLSRPLYTMLFDKSSTGGRIEFGQINPQDYSGSITYAPCQRMLNAAGNYWMG